MQTRRPNHGLKVAAHVWHNYSKAGGRYALLEVRS